MSAIPSTKEHYQLLSEVLNVGKSFNFTCLPMERLRVANINCDNFADPVYMDCDYDIIDMKSKIEFVHFPMADGDNPSNFTALKFLEEAKECLDKGKNVHIHCWGGQKRTWVMTNVLLMNYFGVKEITKG